MNTRTQVLALIKDVSRQQAEDSMLASYLDEVLVELASTKNPPMMKAALFKLTAGSPSYAPPLGAFEICHAFYQDYQLHRADRRQLENLSTTWRTATGDPWAFTTDLEPLSLDSASVIKTLIRFYPTPIVTSVSGVLTEPLGANYPDDHAVLFYGEKRDTNIPDWLVYYIAFEVLYREFVRPSDHRDIPFALLCKDVASLFRVYMGKYDAS